MSTTTTLDSEADLDAAIADLFNLDEHETAVTALPGGYGKSANCTNDGCTRSCMSCGCGRGQ